MFRKLLTYGLICSVVAIAAIAAITGVRPSDFLDDPPAEVAGQNLAPIPRPAFLGQSLEILESPLEEATTADLPAIAERQAKLEWNDANEALIPSGREAVVWKTAFEDYVEYRQRVVKAYRLGTRDPLAAQSAAIAFLEAYSDASARQQGDFKVICGLGDTAVTAGSSDPIVVAFHTRVKQNLKVLEPLPAAAVFRELEKKVKHDAYPPPFVQFLLAAWIAEIAQEATIPDAPGLAMRRLSYESAAKFLAKETGSASPAVLLSMAKTFLKLNAASTEQRKELFQACLAEKQIDPYILHILGGEYYNQLAWDHRGGDFAFTVSRSGWSNFNEFQSRAGRHYRRAWFLHPEFPVAAERMIRISAAGADDSWSPEQWFHAAVTAQLDYHAAYESYMFVSLPRWGGSHQQVAAIAKQCLATGRWDVRVPNEAKTAIGLISQDAELNTPIGSNKTSAQIAAAYIDAFSAAKARGEVKPADYAEPLSYMTAVLVQAGNFKKAREALEFGPEDNDRCWGIERGVGYRYSLGLSYAITSSAEPIVAPIHEFLSREAVDAPSVADVEGMQKRLDEARALDANPKSAGFYDIAGRMLDQLKAYAAGAWVDLKFDPQMTLWTCQAAHLDIIDPATIRMTGSEQVAYLQLRPLTRFAPPFIVEAEVKPVARINGDAGPGIVVGADWVRYSNQKVLPQQLSAGTKIIGLFGYRVRNGQPAAVAFEPDPLPKDGFQHLGVRRYPGRVQFFAMHGRFADDHQPREPINDFVVFGDTPLGGATREAVFRNLRIRRALPLNTQLDTEDPESLPGILKEVEYYPECPESRKLLAAAFSEQGRSAEALEHLAIARAVYPKIIDLNRIEGVARCGIGDFAAGLAAFQKESELFPFAHWARIHEAWVLATAPDDKLRNGHKATQLLDSLRSEFGNQAGIWSFRLTESAVAAENGRLKEAQALAAQAEEAADSDFRRKFVQQVRTVIDTGQPYRMAVTGEIPPPPASLTKK